ncbi:hypothetical protein GCM10017688_13500 [Streptomyces ramulosus]
MRAHPERQRPAQILTGVHVPAHRIRPYGDLPRPRCAVPLPGRAAECRCQFRTGTRGEKGCSDIRRVGEKSPRKLCGALQYGFQFGGAQGRQIGVERGDRRARATRPDERRAVGQRRVETAPRGVGDNPRAERRKRPSGCRIVRDNRHIRDITAGQCGADGVQGESECQPRTELLTDRRGKPALGPHQRLQRYDQAPAHIHSVSSHRIRFSLLPQLAGDRGVTVFST